MMKAQRRLKFISLLLATSLLSAPLAPVVSYAADETNLSSVEDLSNDGPAEGVYYSSGSQKITARGGHEDTLSADVTTIVPKTRMETLDAVATYLDTFANEQLKNAKTTVTFYIGNFGQVVKADRDSILNFVRNIPETVSNDVRSQKSLPLIVAARTAVNAVTTGYVLTIMNGLPKESAIVGGSTAGIMSGTLMLFANNYRAWLNEDPRVRVVFAKGFKTQFIYLLIMKAAIAMTGHPVNASLLATFLLSAKESFFGTATQLPANAAISKITKDRIEAHPEREAQITRNSNLAFLGMSGLVAVLTAMQIAGVKHADLYYYATGIPAWIIYGHQLGWGEYVKKGIQTVKVKLRIGSAAMTEENVRRDGCRAGVESISDL